jgi:hypothetical protein
MQVGGVVLHRERQQLGNVDGNISPSVVDGRTYHNPALIET